MKTRKVTILGEIYLELTVGEDCDGGIEIQAVDNIEALLNYEGSKETPVHLSMEEIHNLTIPKGWMRKSKQEKLEALIDRQDRKEKEQAEATWAEDEVAIRGRGRGGYHR